MNSGPIRATGTVRVDTLTYADWASLISKHFFRPEYAGRPVVLFVDDATVAEVAGSPDVSDSVESLSLAVRKMLSHGGDGPFERLYQQGLAWKMAGGVDHPPFLPALALAVLAAARMHRDASFHSTNYYQRLRELIELPGPGMPTGYDRCFPDLWSYLEWWLNIRLKGSLGLSTAVIDTSLPNIGYALSQTVIKRSDRDRLGEFFTAIDLSAGDRVAGEELVIYYRAWVPRSPLSSAAKRMTSRGEFADELSTILSVELERWDGSTRDETGRQVVHVVMTLEMSERFVAALRIPRPVGFPAEVELADSQGRRRQLTADSDAWYAAIPVHRDDASTPTDFLGDGVTFRFSPRHVYVMRVDFELGCWIAVSRLSPLEYHCLLVDQSVVNAVRDYLDRRAVPGWSRVEGRGLPTGWTLFRDVSIEHARPSDVPEDLASLVPSVQGKVSLWGGLPLQVQVRLYLEGGEPDVWIPDLGAEGRHISVQVDGVDIGEVRDSERISLRSRRLPAGSHVLRIGSIQRAFETTPTLGRRQDDRAGSLVNALVCSGGRYVPLSKADESGGLVPHQVWIAGTLIVGSDDDIPAIPRPPLRLLRGALEYLVLGSRQGEIVRPVCPIEPRWIKTAGLNATMFEVSPYFDVVWVLYRRRSVGWEAKLHASIEPGRDGPMVSDSQLVEDWRAAFRLEPRLAADALSLWNGYQRTLVGPS
jgi:hypothetical protein